MSLSRSFYPSRSERWPRLACGLRARSGAEHKAFPCNMPAPGVELPAACKQEEWLKGFLCGMCEGSDKRGGRAVVGVLSKPWGGGQ